MGGIIVFKRPLEEQIKDAAEQIREWFEANPRRRVCYAQLWTGNRITVHRKTIEEDVRKDLERE